MIKDGGIKSFVRGILGPRVIDVTNASMPDDYHQGCDDGWKIAAIEELEAASKSKHTRYLIEQYLRHCGVGHYRDLGDDDLIVCRQMIRQERSFRKIGLRW